MKLAILSRGPNSYSTRRLKEAALQRDQKVKVLNTLKFAIDIRQRLTVSKGYGVSEIYVPDGSDFVGMTIKDSNLAEKDINVLTLYRGNKVILNPRSDRVLEPLDKLLCFGKLESMRGMIPKKTQRRRRPKVQGLSQEAIAKASESASGES